MSSQEGQADAPDEVARITEALTVHLRDQEVGASATLEAGGSPRPRPGTSPATASWPTSTPSPAFREYQDLLRDPWVSYAVWHEPAGPRHLRRIAEVHGYPATGGCPPFREAAARSSTRGGNRGTAFDR